MMRTGHIYATLCTAILLLYRLPAYSQNLVPNPGFESYTDCPTQIGHWWKMYNWYNPTGASPDYFHTCNSLINEEVGVPKHLSWGYQWPHTGDAYTGIHLGSWPAFHDNPSNYREYIATRLLQPLEPGRSYCVSLHLAINKRTIYAVDQVGVYFSTDSVYTDAYYYDQINAVPQVENIPGQMLDDTTGWVKLSWTFTADSNYAWMTIGNFHDYDHTQATVIRNINPSESTLSYYYLDDIAVEPAPYFVLEDTVLHCNNSIRPGIPFYNSYLWSTGETTDSIMIDEPGLYWLQVTNDCGTYTDEFLVEKSPCFFIPNTFTPDQDGHNEIFKPVAVDDVQDYHFSIYNRWGEEIFHTYDPNAGWDGGNSPGGVYSWSIRFSSDKGPFDQRGRVTLLR